MRTSEWRIQNRAVSGTKERSFSAVAFGSEVHVLGEFRNSARHLFLSILRLELRNGSADSRENFGERGSFNVGAEKRVSETSCKPRTVCAPPGCVTCEE